MPVPDKKLFTEELARVTYYKVGQELIEELKELEIGLRAAYVAYFAKEKRVVRTRKCPPTMTRLGKGVTKDFECLSVCIELALKEEYKEDIRTPSAKTLAELFNYKKADEETRKNQSIYPAIAFVEIYKEEEVFKQEYAKLKKSKEYDVTNALTKVANPKIEIEPVFTIEQKNNTAQVEQYLLRIKRVVENTFFPFHAEFNIPVKEIKEFRLIYRLGIKPVTKKNNDQGNAAEDENVGNNDKNSKLNNTDPNLFMSNELLPHLLGGNNILITGAPGEGKSTFAKWITYTLLDNNPQGYIPIYFELKWLRQNIYDAFTNELKQAGLTEFRGISSDEVKYILVLDGVNEVDSKSELYAGIENIQRHFPIQAIFLTSREEYSRKDIASLDFSIFQIPSLNDSELLSITKRVLGDDAINFREKLKNPILKKLSANRLLLHFLMMHYRNGDRELEFPNKGKLLKSVFEDNFFKNWETDLQQSEKDRIRGVDKEFFLKIFQRIAYKSLKNSSQRVTTSDLNKSVSEILKENGISGESHTTYSYVAEKITYSHILDRLDGDYIFTNNVIQEYCAAAEMVNVFEKGSVASFYFNHSDKRWLDSIEYFTGLVDNPSRFIKQTFRYFVYLNRPSRALTFCARAISGNNDVDETIKYKVVRKLERIINKYNWEKYPWRTIHQWLIHPCRLLAGIRHKDSIPLIANAMEIRGTGHQFRQEMCAALDEVYLTTDAQLQLVDLLMKAKHSDNPYLLLNILGGYVNKNVIEKLRSYLNSKTDFRYRAEWAFTMFSSPFNIGRHEYEPLLAPVISDFVPIILQSDDPFRRSNEFHFDRSPYVERDLILPLLEVAEKNENKTLRLNAIKALSHKSSPLIAPIFYRILHESDSDLRNSIVASMQRIPIPDKQLESSIFSYLIEISSEEGPEFMADVLKALEVNRSQLTNEEIEWVIGKTSNADWYVRACVPQLLKKHKIHAGIPALIDLANREENAFTRAHALNALMSLDISFYEQIIRLPYEDTYIDMLSTDDWNLKDSIMRLLRLMGTEKSYEVAVKTSAGMWGNGKSVQHSYTARDIKRRMDLFTEYKQKNP